MSDDLQLRDPVVPACGGTEQPFAVNGRRWLYVYHTVEHRHGYYDLDNDRMVWNRQFHPAFAPEYEFEPEEPLYRPVSGQAASLSESEPGFYW
jgi:hypothetical protein